MSAIQSLDGCKALVTGATGFIGGRLTEKLALEHGVKVKALIRDYAKGARIAHLPVEFAYGGLSDAESLDAAVQGCDYIFHLAFDPNGSITNVAGLNALAAAAKRHGVKQIVHTSTISVYEPLSDGDLTEQSPHPPTKDPYAVEKRRVEDEALKLARDGAPIAIVQPTIVYGPYSKPWTDGPVGQLLSGIVVLPDGGRGLCNAVYVDDVVDGMILAAIKPEARGETFLLSAAQPCTWAEFYGAYADALGVDSLRYVPSEEIRKQNANPASNAKLLLADPKRALQNKYVLKLGLAVRSRLNDPAKQLLKNVFKTYRSVAPQPVYLPTAQRLALFGTKSHVRIDKARRVLGFEPKFDFAAGMALTTAYVRWAYVEPNAA